jgi:hypothetical protein
MKDMDLIEDLRSVKCNFDKSSMNSIQIKMKASFNTNNKIFHYIEELKPLALKIDYK